MNFLMKRLKGATHDFVIHFLVFLLPYQTWLKLHEKNAKWVGILQDDATSWENVPLSQGKIPSLWKALVHDLIVHPLSIFLPFPMWADIHNRNAKWAFGSVEADWDPNPVPEK